MTRAHEAAARRGSYYMVDVVGANGTAHQTCSVLDGATGRIWPNLRVQSVLARGYWEPSEGEVVVAARGSPRDGDGRDGPTTRERTG